jgi:putative transcriptional regulator
MELIETPVFTRQVIAQLKDDEYRMLQLYLLHHPERGAIVPGSRAREVAMRKDLFDRLVESVKQMKAIEAGRLKPSRVTRMEALAEGASQDVAALRARFKLSQAQFARLLGISLGTLQNWEQNRRRPEGPAKVLLRVAARHPEALLSVTGELPKRRSRRRERAAV